MIDLAVPQEEHPPGVAGRLHGVGHHHDGLAPGVDLRKEAEQAVGGLGVQGAGGLVGQDDLRLRDKGPGHGGPLLLPAGDLVGVLLQQLRNAQLLRDGPELAAHALVVLPRQHQGQEDVILKGEGIQKVKILEDEAQVRPPESGEIPLPDGPQGVSVQQHLAVRGPVQGRQNVEKGSLAGAGLAHDGHILPGLHAEIHVAESLDLGPAEAGGVDLFQVLHL